MMNVVWSGPSSVDLGCSFFCTRERENAPQLDSEFSARNQRFSVPNVASAFSSIARSKRSAHIAVETRSRVVVLSVRSLSLCLLVVPTPSTQIRRYRISTTFPITLISFRAVPRTNVSCVVVHLVANRAPTSIDQHLLQIIVNFPNRSSFSQYRLVQWITRIMVMTQVNEFGSTTNWSSAQWVTIVVNLEY